MSAYANLIRSLCLPVRQCLPSRGSGKEPPRIGAPCCCKERSSKGAAGPRSLLHRLVIKRQNVRIIIEDLKPAPTPPALFSRSLATQPLICWVEDAGAGLYTADSERAAL